MPPQFGGHHQMGENGNKYYQGRPHEASASPAVG